MQIKDICISKTDNYQKQDNWKYFNYLDTGSLIKNKIESFQYIEYEKDLPSRAKQKVSLYDILYSSVRPNQEHYGFIDKEYDNLLVSTGFIILKPIINKVNPKYLYYFLTQKDIVDQLQTIAQNSTSSYPSITKDDILNLEIDLPSLETQNKIVSILSSIDYQIENNNLMVNKLQVLGKIYFEKFSVKINDFINIINISEIIWGQCPDGENILNEESDFTIKYASGAGDIDDGKVSINPKAYTNNSRRFIEKHTVCISVAGTVGKIAIARDKISIGRAMLGFYNEQKYGLIYFSLLKYAPIIQKQATGAIQKIINNNHLEIIDIPLLSASQTNILNSILRQCLRIEEETEKLISLKNKLLPLLINGQLI